MCNIERQTRKHFSMMCPFVCSIMPFVRHKSPRVLPLIDGNRPFVGNKGFYLDRIDHNSNRGGILMAIAAPNMFSFLATNRLAAQTNDLIADINFARSEAIKRNGTVVICKSTSPTATTPTCDQTASDPWETGRLIFLDNEDSSAGISLNYKYLPADNDVLLRIREPLNGNSTLLPNSPSVNPNLSNYLAYTKMAFTTLAAPTAATPHRFKICDKDGRVRGVPETTGRTSLVSDNTKLLSGLHHLYLTCP
jgi:type IV fimbrial biogenesis protein FimT